MESQQEQNLQLIQEALKKGRKRDNEGGAQPQHRNRSRPKQRRHKPQQPNPCPTSLNPSMVKKKKSKGKGKGNETHSGTNGEGEPSDPSFAKAKEQGFRVFFQKGLCTRDPCPFKHEMIASLTLIFETLNPNLNTLNP